MVPPFLLLVGVVALAAGWLMVRRLGDDARVGRILAATPLVDIAHARALAEGGVRRYVGVSGRIDSAQEFEDEHGRPLVYRRTRLETRSGSAWSPVEDVREVVPFEMSTGLETIAVDGDALDTGLVVVTREAEGTAGEILDRIPAGTRPETPVRLRIELLSTVDHAIVLGVPVSHPDAGPMLSQGLGRPLILTNLERDEALRLLAAGRGTTIRLASALLAVGVGMVGVGLAWAVLDAL